MSQDEQMLVMGRTLKEYAEVKSKLAALLSEASRHGDALQRVLWYLRPDQYSVSGLKDGGKQPDLSAYPSAESLRSLFDDALATIERKAILRSQLKEFGVEPRD